jgi:hypothetical protein
MLLVIALTAVAVYFASAGIDLHRRGFTRLEITLSIGIPIALDIVACRGAIVLLRRRRKERSTAQEARIPAV